MTKELPTTKKKRLKKKRQVNYKYSHSQRGKLVDLILKATTKSRAKNPAKEKHLLNRRRVFETVKFELTSGRSWEMFRRNHLNKARQNQHEFIYDVARLLIFLQKETEHEYSTDTNKKN